MTAEINLHRALGPFTSNWPWFLALFAIFIIFKILGSARFKGWLGEANVNRGLRRLDSSKYRSFHDLYLPRPDGQGTTQIDHIVVSIFGVFVIETKNYKGWIFGAAKQNQWTQQIYRKKSRFQNPLHQNHLHFRSLMDFLALPESAFRPFIFFIGDVTFKTPMPANVIHKGLRPWIESQRVTLLDSEQVEQICKTLAAHERASDRKTVAKQHLKDMDMRR